MTTVLDRLMREQVRAHPFPHVVVADALDEHLCDRLLGELPPLRTLTKGSAWGNNLRFDYSAADVAQDHSIARVWRDLVAAHVSQRFLDQVIDLFEPYIRQEHPDFEERFGGLAGLRAGVRKLDTHAAAHVLLDAQISVNTPVHTATAVRGPHLDDPTKLFSGLLYLRRDDDHSAGGDLQLYSVVRSRPPGPDYSLTPEDVRLERTVAYRKNTLVLFLNTARSCHGVSVRGETDQARVFLNLVGVMREPVFSLEPAPSASRMRHGLRRIGARVLAPIRKARRTRVART